MQSLLQRQGVSAGACRDVGASLPRPATAGACKPLMPVRPTTCVSLAALPSLQQGCSSTSLHFPFASRRNSSRSCRRVAVAAAASVEELARMQPEDIKLSALPSSPIVNEQGLINPLVPGCEEQTFKAFVFAIYDPHMKVQYTGFSSDLRNTLRTMVGRRPDKAHFYRAVGLPALDQDRMLKIRNNWFEQLGGPPIGNKLSMERNMWQQPVDAGAISARGRRGAAEEVCRQLQDQLRSMGCVEEFTPNEQLLDDGVVDFLPVGGISEETNQAIKASQAEAKKRTRKAKAKIDGVDQSFEVRYDSILKTNGGYMVDFAVNIDNRATRHRVVVGEHYVQGQGLNSPEVAVESAMAALLEAKLPRQTEGLISMGMFPTNYFSVAGAEQWFPEEFARAFEWNSGKPYKEDTDKMWRFTRTRSYGAAFVDEQVKLKQQEEEKKIAYARSAEGQMKAAEDARLDAEYAEGAI